MEKYSRWRDAGTGIQPFLPPVPPRIESSLLLVLSNVIHYVVGPVLGAIKLVLIAILVLCYILFVKLFGLILIPLGPVRRLWCKVWNLILIRTTLFVAGFFYIKHEVVSTRKSRGDSTNAYEKMPTPSSGDIIVANWTSYIDILYLAYRFNPVFTQIYPAENKVCEISMWQAVRLCSQFPALSAEEKKVPPNRLFTVSELVQRVSARHLGPIVVLPEGTTTNGRALLKFIPIFANYDSDRSRSKFHVLAFSEDVLGERLITSLGNISRLRKTNLSISDKRDFLQYYKTRQSGSAPKSSKKSN
ncbi:uncharacterized protein BYT42DRAFT_495123 [Radiomyces spectabilis]|uniref:uncharacterized protein n=1 Tax=Radiomyces spectabilis TaxID=64574 RepID=UPI00221E8F33|nr:uncharacterized protein BYT42DRAFT_495123 [Radiomyces spectabilis]KAI8380881.1 hypothetical protein BYT42DRAFT_495123 [Radiomyces spectabilis]